MKIEIRVLCTILCLILAANVHVYARTGTATFYKLPYTPSACFGNENRGNMIAGASKDWWNRAVCGKRYRVRCIGSANAFSNPCGGQGSPVEVTIVDKCDSCNGTINLSIDAFQKIANPKAGKIKVQFDLI